MRDQSNRTHIVDEFTTDVERLDWLAEKKLDLQYGPSGRWYVGGYPYTKHPRDAITAAMKAPRHR